MRYVIGLVLFLACFAGPGCGGGGSGSSSSALPQVAVLGTVISRDGSTTALDGVDVLCPEAQTHVTTDADGTFRFDVPAGHPFHLDFADPAWPTADGHRGPHESWDAALDPTEIDGPGVACRPVGAPDWCEVEVYLEQGEIVECQVRWPDTEGETWTGEGPLDCPIGDEVPTHHAEVETDFDGTCLSVEVEVEGLVPESTYDVSVLDLEGNATYVSSFETDADGLGHLEWTWCDGEPLPFDHADPLECLGLQLVVTDETGEVVFEGHLPHPMLFDAGHHHGDPGYPGMGPHHGWGQ